MGVSFPAGTSGALWGPGAPAAEWQGTCADCGRGPPPAGPGLGAAAARGRPREAWGLAGGLCACCPSTRSGRTGHRGLSFAGRGPRRGQHLPFTSGADLGVSFTPPTGEAGRRGAWGRGAEPQALSTRLTWCLQHRKGWWAGTATRLGGAAWPEPHVGGAMGPGWTPPSGRGLCVLSRAARMDPAERAGPRPDGYTTNSCGGWSSPGRSRERRCQDLLPSTAEGLGC